MQTGANVHRNIFPQLFFVIPSFITFCSRFWLSGLRFHALEHPATMVVVSRDYGGRLSCLLSVGQSLLKPLLGLGDAQTRCNLPGCRVQGLGLEQPRNRLCTRDVRFINCVSELNSPSSKNLNFQKPSTQNLIPELKSSIRVLKTCRRSCFAPSTLVFFSHCNVVRRKSAVVRTTNQQNS